MISGVRRAARAQAELLAVVLAAAVGLAVPSPGRTLVDHDAIDVVLAVLVFSAALTLPLRVGSRLRRHGARLLAVSLVVSACTIVIAWVASRFVDPGPLRLGVLAVGVAPVEIATVGIAPAGGGDVLASAVLLGVSVLSTAVLAAPVLALLASGAHLHVATLLTNVVLVVVVPFVAGLVLRTAVPAPLRAAAPLVVTIAVTLLVWLVASTARLSSAYVGVVVALAFVIVVGALLGSAIARAVDPVAGTSVLFAASMRDFAIAAGIVTAAFGARAAAPLGLYGIMVMVWGTGLAGVLRRRRPATRRT